MYYYVYREEFLINPFVIAIFQEFLPFLGVIFLLGIIELSINIDAFGVKTYSPQPQETTTIVDVTTFGAVGDGKTDDSQVFSSYC